MSIASNVLCLDEYRHRRVRVDITESPFDRALGIWDWLADKKLFEVEIRYRGAKWFHQIDCSPEDIEDCVRSLVDIDVQEFWDLKK